MGQKSSSGKVEQVNTFLPYPSFAHSAACLDRARLGKQRIDCQDILTCLRAPEGLPAVWQDQPATEMWRGYESALALYSTMINREWDARGYTNSLTPIYNVAWERYMWADARYAPDARQVDAPPWLGDERLHQSHRRALMYTCPEYYRDFEWRVVPELNYWWPEKEKTA